MKYYSQIGQDAYYIERIINGRTQGRFLDVGAHDGIQTSNTYALEKELQWTGICVEANPTLAKQCELNRPGSQVVEAAVWSDVRSVSFELPHSGNDFLSRIGGIDCNANYFADDFREVTTLEMITRPLSQIIGEDPAYFDYFSLDIEGAEIEALKGINWSTTGFGFIAIEFGHRQSFLSEIVTFMKSKGYELHRINDFDADFAPKS
jgi:FkbM family methyltransferase